MHDLPLEPFIAGHVDAFGLVELPCCSDQEVTGDLVRGRELGLFPAANSNRRLPLAGLVIPISSFDSRMESCIFVQPILLSYIGEIVLPK